MSTKKLCEITIFAVRMKNMLLNKIQAGMLIVLSSGLVLAQPNEQDLSNTGSRTITTAVPFLMISPDAKAGGYADQGVSTEPDANSMHWNVGKLALADKNMSIAVSYTPWLRQLVPDINLAYLGFYKKIGGRTCVGASIRYFSLGDITFTDNNGNTIGQYNPNEFAIDAGASLKLSDHWSGGIAFRFIYSNLTLGQNVQGAATNPGLAGAGDLGFFYQNPDRKLFKRPVTWRFGVSITNIGNKVKYSETQPDGDYIPINLRLGTSNTLQIDKHNKLTISLELSKLMVPSVPIYKRDSLTNEIIYGDDGKPVILKGMDPNRNVIAGMFSSLWDSPAGFEGEMSEFTIASGAEYWYNNLFRAAFGFFYEPRVSGNRQYFTLGAGVRYKIFGLDFSYLIPTVQRNPLEHTVRFTLSFNFTSLKKKTTEGGETPNQPKKGKAKSSPDGN
ncbi:MAG: type IX secretion system outer membrane channel protein PorV [Flavobacteriales bacterium]|nr:type IX secretion system outer membrane channel protein PorV [Flavobacteriales bacterium]